MVFWGFYFLFWIGFADAIMDFADLCMALPLSGFLVPVPSPQDSWVRFWFAEADVLCWQLEICLSGLIERNLGQEDQQKLSRFAAWVTFLC